MLRNSILEKGFIKLPRTTLRELGKGPKLLAYIDAIDSADFKAKKITAKVRELAARWGLSRSVVGRIIQVVIRDLEWDNRGTALGQESQAGQGFADGSRDNIGTTVGHTIIEHRNNTPLPPKNYVTELPDWLDTNLWEELRQHRIEKKKPFTARSEKMQLSILKDLVDAGHSQKAIIGPTIAGDWTGLFPPNQQTPFGAPPGHKKESL